MKGEIWLGKMEKNKGKNNNIKEDGDIKNIKDLKCKKNEEKLSDIDNKENLEDFLQDKLTKLENDYQELNDKYLRCLAEYDNFRKRTNKEKERMFSDGIVYSVRGFLDVLDNFERALKFETKDIELKKGFDMIFNQFLEIIKKLGIEEIKTENEVFNPIFHNAVMHVEDKKYGKSQIVETLQKGYKIGDNVIRYAMVKVAN